MSTSLANRVGRKPDAFFPWCEEQIGTEKYAPLADVLEALRALNPSLSLQEDDGYLFFDQSRAESVVEIVLPAPASDDMMCSISAKTKDWLWMQTSFGEKQLGPHHFERTAVGNLLVRPASSHWSHEAGRFGGAYQQSLSGNKLTRMPSHQIGRVQKDWGIFRDPGYGELWEVDYAYMPAAFADHSLYGTRTQREWWETTPIGTISFACKGDLPLETHIERAKEIVAAGSEFAIVGDLERFEYRVYRPNGMKIETEEFALPEMPWFVVPKILSMDNSRTRTSRE